MEKNLTTGSVFKNIVLFSLPYLLSYFLQTLYGMADLFIIGQFEGVASTTAVSIGSQVMHMLTVMIVGLSMGTTVSVGQAVGAGDRKQAAHNIGNTVILFLVVSIALTAILLSLVHPIVVAMSTPTDAVSGMQHAAARKIDCGIGKAELPDKPAPQANAPAIVDFQPYMGKVRKPGTGCISQINDHLFEGRYSPTWIDGKKHARNVYAHTREECEEKLKVLIAEMKAELAELKRQKGDRH